MSVRTTIGNYALGHLAIGTRIADIDATTDRSRETLTLRQFIDDVIEEYLRDAIPVWSKRIAALALVEENPNSRWRYAYRYPSGCVNFLGINNGATRRAYEDLVETEQGHDDGGRLIYTNQPRAEAEWIILSDIGRWPVDSRIAASFLLAYYAAPTLTNGDKFKLGQAALQKYQLWKGKANANALGEQQQAPTNESGFSRAR
jgi:hypothetical protein